MISFGSVELLQKLPRLDRERLHVSLLAFGKERIKREARFSAAAEATDRQPLPVRDREAYVFQVVDSNIRQFDCGIGHQGISGRRS